jgi:hypothetical protein
VSNGDKNFAEYLDGKSTISEKYAALPDVDPPAELDAVILAEAARAAKTHSHSATTRSWVIPVSVAATVMICFSLVLNILREVPSGIDTDQGMDAIIPTDSFDAPSSMPSLAGKARPAAPAGADEALRQESLRRQLDAGTGAFSENLYELRENATGDRRQSTKAEEAAAPAARLAPLVATPPAQAPQRRADTAITQQLPAGRPMEAEQLMVLGQMMEVVTGYLHPEATELKELRDALELAADADSLVVLEAEKSAFSGMASSSATKQSDRPVPEQAAPDEPDSLLQKIVELYAQGQNRAAEEALDEFRQAFPDHPLSRRLLERGY